MIWLTWRQHRSHAFILLALLAVAVAAFLPLGLRTRSAYAEGGIAACLTVDTDTCSRVLVEFSERFTPVNDVLTIIALVFGLVGALIGGPLIAREYEQGTWRLVWTQAVPRTRWLVTKLGLTAAGLALFTFALAQIIAWYRAPLDRVPGNLWTDTFDLGSLSLTGYVLFSFAAGVLAGQLLRRPVAAVGVAFVAFLIVKIPATLWLRPHYLAPLTFLGPATGGSQVGPRDWVLDTGLVDATGRRLTPAQTTSLLDGMGDADYASYVSAHHLQEWTLYHPADRFWTFQFMEFGVLAGLALLILAVAIWRLRRRGI